MGVGFYDSWCIGELVVRFDDDLHVRISGHIVVGLGVGFRCDELHVRYVVNWVDVGFLVDVSVVCIVGESVGDGKHPLEMVL